MRLARHFQSGWRNDNAIIVGINEFTGAERDTRKRHGHVDIAHTATVALERMTGQSLHAEIGLREHIDVANAAVNNNTFPAILAALSAIMSPSKA